MGNKKSIFQFVSPVFPSLPPHNSPVTRLLPVLWAVGEAPLAPVSALIAGVSARCFQSGREGGCPAEVRPPSSSPEVPLFSPRARLCI